MILREFVLGPFASNCFIVGCEETKEGMVVDPGAQADVILKNIRELGLTIKTIVLTHNHIDHISALRKVKEETGAEFAIHEDDANEEAWERYDPLMASMVSFQSPPKPDRLLKGGDVIEVGKLRFTVLHTPGHSPGGICLYGHGAVFSGDTLFNQGIGRTDFPGCSHAQLMNSIYTKLLVLPDETLVLPGHGPETTIGDERRWNPFFRL